jgi:CheY-like chemotaxis protein
MPMILVIDDNVNLQIAFKKEGLRLARETRPDVIVLDMMLPKLSGLDVLRALKQDHATASIPVIALSGLPLSNEARLRKDGVIKYLQKSSLENLDLLLQTIDYALIGQSKG